VDSYIKERPHSTDDYEFESITRIVWMQALGLNLTKSSNIPTLIQLKTCSPFFH